ncbi:hypothetical protein VTJ04DRAFT_10890 [Mycothermus thermophilus]|uniref:uncharacterized protein n=1 Tax=Humicola insolens TaxID=85995 RepID=UPI0037421B51
MESSVKIRLSRLVIVNRCRHGFRLQVSQVVLPWLETVAGFAPHCRDFGSWRTGGGRNPQRLSVAQGAARFQRLFWMLVRKVGCCRAQWEKAARSEAKADCGWLGCVGIPHVRQLGNCDSRDNLRIAKNLSKFVGVPLQEYVYIRAIHATLLTSSRLLRFVVRPALDAAMQLQVLVNLYCLSNDGLHANSPYTCPARHPHWFPRPSAAKPRLSRAAGSARPVGPEAARSDPRLPYWSSHPRTPP